MKLDYDLWQLAMAMESLHTKEDSDVMVLYSVAAVLNKKANETAVSAGERMWSKKLFDDAKNEVNRRHLDFLALYISMDKEGNFLTGRDELKKLWLSMDFDDMEEIADYMREHCISEEQRLAIIELEREVVIET